MKKIILSFFFFWISFFVFFSEKDLKKPQPHLGKYITGPSLKQLCCYPLVSLSLPSNVLAACMHIGTKTTNLLDFMFTEFSCI